MSCHRHGRQAEGADESALAYGSMGAFGKRLTQVLRDKKLDMKAKDWGHQGKGNQQQRRHP